MEPCFYECGREANSDDHIVPVNDGGAHNAANYVRACRPCNEDRAHTPIGEYMAARGLDKPVPTGLTDIEYKLTRYRVEDLTIAVCLWCEKPFVTVKAGVKCIGIDASKRYCSSNHRKKFSRMGRARKAGN